MEENGIAMFPDAPTERGLKHLRELIRCKELGYGAAVLFVVKMKGIRCFRPNDRTHAAFGDALRDAQKAGVRILVMDCIVEENTLTICAPIPAELEGHHRTDFPPET